MPDEILTEVSDHVLVITINRPAAKNAIDGAVAEGLVDALAQLDSTEDLFVGVVTGAGLPSFIAYGVYVGEVVAPLMLLLGYWTRVGGLIIVINMLVAIGLVHMGQLATLAGTGGWALELQGIFLGTALAIMLLGAGRYSLGGSGGRWN